MSALGTRTTRAMQGRHAGIVSRIVADAIDLLIVAAVALAAFLGFSAVRFVVRPARFTWPHLPTSLSITLVLLVLVVYLAIGWSGTGRTGGKQVMGLRLVNRRGDRLTLWSALVRAVLCVAFPLGLAWCAIDRRSRSLQDLLSGTSVLYDWVPHRPALHETATPHPRAADGEPGTPQPASPRGERP